MSNHKNFKIILIVLTITSIFSVGFYLSRIQYKTNAESIHPQNYIELIDSTQIPTLQPENNINLQQTVNDISVTVTYAKIIPSGIEIGTCFTTPDGGEWNPGPGPIVLSDGKTISPDEFGTIRETQADSRQMGEMCNFIKYRVEDLSSISIPFKVAIKFLHSPAREMYSACENLQHRLNTSPKAYGSEIKMECKETTDQLVSPTVIGHASTISQEEAQAILDEMAGNIIYGPWEFTINSIQK